MGAPAWGVRSVGSPCGETTGYSPSDVSLAFNRPRRRRPMSFGVRSSGVSKAALVRLISRSRSTRDQSVAGRDVRDAIQAGTDRRTKLPALLHNRSMRLVQV